ncbi:hypothetical protein D9C73_023358 [Collichthys lucidus]|uniref:Uncharacterized protein n=1 Tax=Collichthys lucidus TaxID=240159 RepID=A0A4V6AV55_COLLU|nr:hypothetical protein D9C73_023358 [Collichthys lucidus]
MDTDGTEPDRGSGNRQRRLVVNLYVWIKGSNCDTAVTALIIGWLAGRNSYFQPAITLSSDTFLDCAHVSCDVNSDLLTASLLFD